MNKINYIYIVIVMALLFTYATTYCWYYSYCKYGWYLWHYVDDKYFDNHNYDDTDDEIDDDTDDKNDHGKEDANDHKKDSYTAARAAPGCWSVENASQSRAERLDQSQDHNSMDLVLVWMSIL